MGKTIHCWTCGVKLNKKRHWNGIGREYCDECFENEKKNAEDYQYFRKINMHNTALFILERQKNANIEDYKEASEVVLDFVLEGTKSFDSSSEIVAAMELIKQRVHCRVQEKILNYRVDFVLPDFQVVLEIDGDHHKSRITYDGQRDIEIRKELNKSGGKWEVVRIPTEHINTNVRKLLDAVIIVSDRRRELRGKNDGFLPSHYEKKDEAIANEIAGIK